MPSWIWGIGLVVLVAGLGLSQSAGVGNTASRGFMGDFGKKPQIWWYVDDSQTNSREWLDWGDRETVEPNEPYLRICLAKTRGLWSYEFDIVPLIGREAVVNRVRAAGGAIPSGWGEVPPALWMAWARAALLSAEGGLWLDGSVLPMADGRSVWRRTVGSGKSAIVFGWDPTEAVAAGAVAASPAAGWAASAGHPVWSGLAHDIGALIGAGAQSWSSAEARNALRNLWDRHCTGGAVFVDRAAEVSRDKYGRRLELDTLLGTTDWTAGSLTDGMWVPLPDGRDSLERTVPYQWFLRLSEEQIRESQFVWARWATRI